jgi:hypothetical protein
MKIGIGQPLMILWFDVAEALLVLEEGDCAHPVPFVYIVLQLWDLVLGLFYQRVQPHRHLLFLFCF